MNMGFLGKPKRAIQKWLAGFMETQENVFQGPLNYNSNRRGVSVYSISQLVGIKGRASDGRHIVGQYEQSLYYLTLDERIAIARLCSPVAGIITSRMNRISSLDWTVTWDKDYEDREYERMKTFKQVFDEFGVSKEIKHIVARAEMVKEIQRNLPDVLPDLSNMDKALLRWNKRNKVARSDQADMVSHWLRQPNINDTFEAWLKKYVFDLMAHGTGAIYKEKIDGKLENFYMLPGGTVYPLKHQYVSGPDAYVQVTMGHEPLIYFGDEVSYSNYLPTSARAWGNIPLEALINKVTESLLFDKLMANQADGTQMPNKALVVGEQNPFGTISEFNNTELDVDEQVRIENKINTPKKGGAIVFSGNTATVVDLSRENTMQIQMQRQKDIREEVGLVFNASNMEMNLTGSSNTSGRETSETQQEISEGRGVVPIAKQIEAVLCRDIIPFRFGTGFKFTFEVAKNEREEFERLKLKMDTGLFGVNEVRETDLNLDPVEGDEYNKPPAPGQAQQGQPGPETIQ